MDKRLTILQGNSLDVLKGLPDASVQTCVTSPPYWGLRSYLPKDHPLKKFEIGTEKTPEQFVAKLVAVFSQVRRVLKDDGTLWVNIGDSYNNSDKWGGGKTNTGKHTVAGDGTVPSFAVRTRKPNPAGLKPKDLVGVPWMLAFALRADGWYLRSDIIWSKPNPMPESVTDRPTKAHEYIFLLSKSAKYFYDSESIKEPSVTNDMRRPYGSKGAWELDGRPAEQQHGGEARGRGGKKAFRGQGANRDTEAGPANRDGRDMTDAGTGEVRNKRSVWEVATAPYSDAHFATFPPELILPCIRAGSRLGDTVLDCFGGSGTTGKVALEEGRKAILIELNPDYHPLIQQRCNVTPGLPI